MPKAFKVCRASLLLILALAIAACSPEPRRYEFTLQTTGGPTGWPIWGEELSFDHAWGGPMGNSSEGFERPPRPYSTVILGTPLPAPESMQARWFSYRNQTFYEIDLDLPADLDERLRRWYRDYPPSRYLHYLVAGLSGRGEVYVWWRSWCKDCEQGLRRNFYMPIVASAFGKEAEGDPGTFRSQTQRRIEEGEIPSPW